MEKKLTIEHLAPYLPYGLTFVSEMDKPYDEIGKQPKWTCIGITTVFKDYCFITKENNDAYSISLSRPILRPLSQLTQEIEHNGERFEPAYWFELCDDENDSLEFDFGNVQLIKTLKDIAKYNVHHDINYLPFYVVQKLIEWKFDIYGLIDAGLAIEEGGRG